MAAVLGSNLSLFRKHMKHYYWNAIAKANQINQVKNYTRSSLSSGVISKLNSYFLLRGLKRAILDVFTLQEHPLQQLRNQANIKSRSGVNSARIRTATVTSGTFTLSARNNISLSTSSSGCTIHGHTRLSQPPSSSTTSTSSPLLSSSSSSTSPTCPSSRATSTAVHPPSRPPSSPLPGPRPKFNSDIVKSFPIGFLASCGGACAGIGGSLFSIPLLGRYTTLTDQRLAAGTAIFAVMATASGSMYAFYQQDKVCLDMAVFLCTSAGVAAPVGAWVGKKMTTAGLAKILGGFLMATAPMLWIREAAKRYVEEQNENKMMKQVEATSNNPEEPQRQPEQSQVSAIKAEHKSVWDLLDDMSHIELDRRGIPLILVGSSAGFISGLLGVGGGMLFTPIIALMSTSTVFLPTRILNNNSFKFDFRTVLGTSFASMFLPAVTTAISYTRMGYVRFSMVPGLIAGAFAGAKVGSYYALRLDEDLLRVVFTVVFGALGWRYLRKPGK